MSTLETYKQLAGMFAVKIKHNVEDMYGYYMGTKTKFSVDRVNKITVEGEDIHIPRVSCLQKVSLYLSNATLITEEYGFKIYIGNSWNASNLDFLKQNEIDRILNVSIEVPNFFENNIHFDYRRYAIRDISEQPIDFSTLVQFCQDAIQHSPNILIHCFMGASRSVLVCLVILSILSKKYDEEQKTTEELYQLILSKRPKVHINKTFFKKWKEFNENAIMKSH